MNINPNATVILCFGDSNTRGTTPTENRYPANVRWTGLLQEKLGGGYYVIEEGLGGRTTVNGKTYLLPCLKTHNPIDLVILMLGTNDLQERFHQSPEEISTNLETLVKMIIEIGFDKNNKPPKIILLSPPLVAEEKSRQLAKLYQAIAQKYGCEFIDIAKVVQPSKIDGLHLEPEAHSRIAGVLFEKINNHKFSLKKSTIIATTIPL
ncbi:acylhydrolase [Candidatus Daviesbacteria bacterium]|nr:acylhydrolase [Candidatus Daviesbacteria bacterium]